MFICQLVGLLMLKRHGNDYVMIAVTQLAQTVTCSVIGKITLDKTFMEKDTLNANIVVSFFF